MRSPQRLLLSRMLRTAPSSQNRVDAGRESSPIRCTACEQRIPLDLHGTCVSVLRVRAAPDSLIVAPWHADLALAFASQRGFPPLTSVVDVASSLLTAQINPKSFHHHLPSLASQPQSRSTSSRTPDSSIPQAYTPSWSTAAPADQKPAA